MQTTPELPGSSPHHHLRRRFPNGSGAPAPKLRHAAERRETAETAEWETAWARTPGLSGAKSSDLVPARTPRCPPRGADEQGLTHDRGKTGDWQHRRGEAQTWRPRRFRATSVAPAPSPPQGPRLGCGVTSASAGACWIDAVRDDCGRPADAIEVPALLARDVDGPQEGSAAEGPRGTPPSAAQAATPPRR